MQKKIRSLKVINKLLETRHKELYHYVLVNASTIDITIYSYPFLLHGSTIYVAQNRYIGRFSFLLIWSTILDNKKYRVMFLMNINNNQQVTDQAAEAATDERRRYVAFLGLGLGRRKNINMATEKQHVPTPQHLHFNHMTKKPSISFRHFREKR